jgi:hypothetical protein
VGNGEDLVRWRGETGRALRVQRLHRDDDVQRFSQQLDLSIFRDESPRKQMMDMTFRADSLRVRHVFGEDLVGRHDENDVGRRIPTLRSLDSEGRPLAGHDMALAPGPGASKRTRARYGAT